MARDASIKQDWLWLVSPHLPLPVSSAPLLRSLFVRLVTAFLPEEYSPPTLAEVDVGVDAEPPLTTASLSPERPDETYDVSRDQRERPSGETLRFSETTRRNTYGLMAPSTKQRHRMRQL
jgi:hypothetical protein